MSPGAPTPRTSWFRMTFIEEELLVIGSARCPVPARIPNSYRSHCDTRTRSADGVREQGHLPGVLAGGGDVALVLGAVAGDPAGADLAPVAHELAQQVDVLVVDVVLMVRAELAELALGLALEGALGHVLVLPFGGSPFLGSASRRFLVRPLLLERRLVVELTTLAGPGRAARPVAAAAAARAAPAGALDL